MKNYLKKLRDTKSNVDCYRMLQEFVEHLWDKDIISNYVYDEISWAMEQYAKSKIESHTKIITVKYRFLPRELSEVDKKHFNKTKPTCMDVERKLSNGKWDFAHYFDTNLWDFTKATEDEFWEMLIDRIQSHGYKGYTHIPTRKYKDARYKVLNITNKEINLKTWTGKCIVEVMISNIH